ncbi:hypothetical protein DSO57_1015117 [Entomophthora muscae]|uniref:Uncharacterized protein n=1 Tax=Entomophthora muscae TaxID=34485 RepID=A0ACC2SU12_9FUNG|nr:hypothetical protein DSO57_1015117 [Entomophthora muscae]
MVLTTGAVSPLAIPFAITFSGPLPPPIQEPTLPEITSPPIEEDITNLPIIPNVLNLGVKTAGLTCQQGSNQAGL